MLFGSKSQLNKLDIDSISVSGNDIPLSNSCRNLGVIFYSQMSMSKQTTSICKSVRYQLRNIGFIRKYLTRSATEKLVHSLISSRLDFGNGLLYNLPNSQIGQLQKLQNAAARIVSLSSKRSHITPILKTVHWLPVKERIIFKILIFVYYIVNGTAPDYNKSLLRLYQPTRTLRSSHSGLLQIPLSKKSWGNELLLMPDQPCGIHFHRSWRTQILQHPLSATLRLTNLAFEDRYYFFMMYIRFSCHVCNLFCLCCKASWAFNQNGYGAI